MWCRCESFPLSFAPGSRLCVRKQRISFRKKDPIFNNGRCIPQHTIQAHLHKIVWSCYNLKNIHQEKYKLEIYWRAHRHGHEEDEWGWKSMLWERTEVGMREGERGETEEEEDEEHRLFKSISQHASLCRMRWQQSQLIHYYNMLHSDFSVTSQRKTKRCYGHPKVSQRESNAPRQK